MRFQLKLTSSANQTPGFESLSDHKVVIFLFGHTISFWANFSVKIVDWNTRKKFVVLKVYHFK